jgi:hypothetical protein
MNIEIGGDTFTKKLCLEEQQVIFFPDFARLGALALAAGEPGGIGLLEFPEPWMPGTEPVPGIKNPSIFS